MAKQNMIQRDWKRSKLIERYKKNRNTLKESFQKATSFEEKVKLHSKLQKLPRDSAPCRHRNRCWYSGRSRGYYRDFGLSRHVLREMGHQCLLPGLTKSSW